MREIPLALVTGATGMVGRAVALALADRGHPLVLSGRNAAGLAEVAGAAEGRGVKVRTDLGTLDGPEDAARLLAAAGGPVDVVVNAAGTIGPIAVPEEVGPASFAQTIGTNLIGPMSLSLAALAPMRTRGWGRVINVSSAQTLHPPDGYLAAYVTSKSALNAATRCLADALRGSQVSACLIHPGNLRSAMWEEIQSSARTAGAQHLSTWATGVADTGGDEATESGHLVATIVERDAAWSNGRFLTIPGGFDHHPVPW